VEPTNDRAAPSTLGERGREPRRLADLLQLSAPHRLRAQPTAVARNAAVATADAVQTARAATSALGEGGREPLRLADILQRSASRPVSALSRLAPTSTIAQSAWLTPMGKKGLMAADETEPAARSSLEPAAGRHAAAATAAVRDAAGAERHRAADAAAGRHAAAATAAVKDAAGAERRRAANAATDAANADAAGAKRRTAADRYLRREKSHAHARVGNAVYTEGSASALAMPKSYTQALATPQAAEWQAAMTEHLTMHEQLETFKEVSVPYDTRTLPCRWVFATKTDGKGTVTRYKARTVVFGNLQKPGIDYKETFSPTVRGEQVRLMLAIGAQVQGNRLRARSSIDVTGQHSDVLSIGDVKNAYLNSPLDEENVLMELPPGYVPTLKAAAGYKIVARHCKAHPGLRQAGRAWYNTIRQRLVERG
jgi:hypothetical protein